VPLFSRKKADAFSWAAARKGGSLIARLSLAYVQERETNRVRVEDYLTVLGAMTGEAALLSAGLIELETTDLVPGSGIFGEAINTVLTGPDPSRPTGASVVGVLASELVPATYPASAFDDLEALYARIAATWGSVAWGMVPLSVGADNLPTVIPLRVAYELRPVVDATVRDLGIDPHARYAPCAIALASALQQVQEAIDRDLALRLALETVFGTAKMVPMSKRRFAEVNGPADIQVRPRARDKLLSGQYPKTEG
jgi:hypothetical protein